MYEAAKLASNLMHGSDSRCDRGGGNLVGYTSVVPML